MSGEAGDKSKELRVEEEAVPALSSGVFRPDVDTSSIDERKLMRKIDWHVVPWPALLYLLNFLDRGNIGNARVCRLTCNGNVLHAPQLSPLALSYAR